MFTKTAKYYDFIYSFKNYAAEAEAIAALIRRERPAARTILDACCGSGEHARLLSSSFTVDGFDVEADFVEMAQRKTPQGHFVVADMRHVELGRKYDVVLCLFSSIGYLLSVDEVVAARTLQR